MAKIWKPQWKVNHKNILFYNTFLNSTDPIIYIKYYANKPAHRFQILARCLSSHKDV